MLDELRRTIRDWIDPNGCHKHRFKVVGSEFTVDHDDGVTLKLLRCANCGLTASFDHNDQLEWSYK